MEFIYVAAGSFNMGSNDGDIDEKPIHKVEITNGFYIGKYEVTQAQWLSVMMINPSKFKANSKPVEQVSWNDVQLFIDKLNQKEGKELYRLPTEAEWEYAARGGNQSRGYIYAGGNDVRAVARFNGDLSRQTHIVGSKAPNELGIYDMSGNVWELCQDWYSSGYYSQSPIQDPKGAINAQNRIIRGGSWKFDSSNMRVANRINLKLDNRDGDLGFRLVRIVN